MWKNYNKILGALIALFLLSWFVNISFVFIDSNLTSTQLGIWFVINSFLTLPSLFVLMKIYIIISRKRKDLPDSFYETYKIAGRELANGETVPLFIPKVSPVMMISESDRLNTREAKTFGARSQETGSFQWVDNYKETPGIQSFFIHYSFRMMIPLFYFASYRNIEKHYHALAVKTDRTFTNSELKTITKTNRELGSVKQIGNKIVSCIPVLEHTEETFKKRLNILEELS